MKQEIQQIEINGIVYIPKDSVAEPALRNSNNLRFVIVRTYSAGVHFGYLDKHDGKEVVLVNSRRVWYWKGAASLSQMAVDGVLYPDECKFSVNVSMITLTEAIEILECTEKARKNLEGVKQWKQ